MEHLTRSTSHRFAASMLILATLFWGMGFAWAKNVGEAGNAAAHLEQGNLFGPNLMLALRFAMASIIWMIVFPKSPRGWNRLSLVKGMILGLILAAGVIPQHLGLDRSSEAVIAFLTNLTVVIVPIMVAIITRKLPASKQIAAVLIALIGIYLLTGAKSSGLSAGEYLGVFCAVSFSLELILLNRLLPGESMQRMTLMIFVMCAISAACVAGYSWPTGGLEIDRLTQPGIVLQLALLTIFTTTISFGLMTAYQPMVSPTQAAIIYLFEPVFAAAYAWVAQPDAAMSRLSLIGAGLILLANLVAEIQWSSLLRKRNGVKQNE